MKTTPFTETHISLGAKMHEFAGYNMPIEYSGIIDEHLTVCQGVGVFDVSHMGEFWVKGPNALAFIQSVTSNDASVLPIGKAQYTCFPNDKGGIVDDLLVYHYEPEKYLLVVNAGNIAKDWDWCVSHNTVGAELENSSDRTAQLAVQGPKAVEVLQRLTPVDLSSIPYYSFVTGEFAGCKNVIISNCTLTSTSAAIKIGTEGVADFENILVDNCIITGSNRGLSIQIRDGGCVRNVSFSNIMIETRRFAECWWGCAEPIVMTTHDRNANTHSGSIENVRFFNVTCKGENGVFLSGNEENHIKNVLFENVNVCLEATSKWERGMYDLRPIPPEKEGMLHQKNAAMFLRWVDGITIRNSTLGFAGEDRSDFAQGLLTQNCTNVQTMGLTAEAATPEYESIQLG